ncbi:NAD+ synthase [Halopseudomonas oceani]|uniref:Glutamine-dependent NAD(+) synthetase n=1 Tax=Halopseudomonas oceani TaxID=1708783 RepID=A0A2P4EY27_9GAMM|nr:NAD+ synthase [Halopseudomonas oceani]POB05119.1 NAD+ synthase [Halopseudomonas oceani]GGE33293.1 NAD+ synthase [Halopseudomonas oceani]
MTATLRIVMAQLNMRVGDIPGNLERIIEASRHARDELGARVIVFPELSLCGYPPEDLLLRSSMQARISRALDRLCAEVHGIYVVVGYPWQDGALCYNMAAVIADGRILASYAKQQLPNYRVFDEKRYFTEGQDACCLEIDGLSVAITVCEDIWHPQPMAQARDAGARLMLNLNASPFHMDKQREREAMLAERAAEGAMPIIYVNQVGGQDELVFDGGSVAVDTDGQIACRVAPFCEGLYPVDVQFDDAQVRLRQGALAAMPEVEASVYQALVTGVRDYVNKNRFKGVVLGLSGGIDSALTLAVAVDALGAERVEAVMMPYHYTSGMSLEDAEAQARTMHVTYRVLPIAPMVEAFMQTLEPVFEGLPRDTTEENLQARCRGTLLMALSNKTGSLVLTTGNKSEMAVGYATLYGDMAGGFDVLKDVPKTLVFRLAEYRNTLGAVIPQRVIDRPPSAELAPDQKDEDSLPPYPVLDEILRLYIEHDLSASAIIAAGFDEDQVKRVVRLVDLNEYKRRQAAVGARVTQRGFGRDRRYPITSGWAMED